MRNPEVIYFEGLPRSGKTTLTRQISANFPHTLAIEEYIHPELLLGDSDNQKLFMENDELKYQLARLSGRQCLVDRGHLSTVLYSHAYSRFQGDRDLSHVNEWYFGKILKEKMLPDLYIYIDTSAEASLNRRTLPLDWNNMWDRIEALNFARENYPKYMGMFEPSVPVLSLSSDSMSIEELRNTIVSFLGLDINYKSI